MGDSEIVAALAGRQAHWSGAIIVVTLVPLLRQLSVHSPAASSDDEVLPVFFIGIQAITFVAGQEMGRVLYTSNGYRMAFDIHENFYVGFTFKVAGKPAFVDGVYHLKKSIGTSYILDLSSSELCNWYTRMEELSPGIGLKAGDLITSIYRGSDTMFTKFQGRDVRFVRVTYPLVAGTFLFPDDGEKAISFETTSDGKVSITVSCGATPPARTHSAMALILRESPYQTPRSFYDVASESMNTYNKFIADVQTSCPGLSVTNGSLGGLLFASRTVIITQFAESRVQLRRK